MGHHTPNGSHCGNFPAWHYLQPTPIISAQKAEKHTKWGFGLFLGDLKKTGGLGQTHPAFEISTVTTPCNLRNKIGDTNVVIT